MWSTSYHLIAKPNQSSKLSLLFALFSTASISFIIMSFATKTICALQSIWALQPIQYRLNNQVNNLKFSTNPDPKKCQTKTLAFLKKPLPLPNLYLCGNPLPWTKTCKHLGITVENKIDGCEYDMSVKNAQYINKNIELNQEFFFAHPFTKIKVNKIYNSHFYGSPLWNLFGSGALRIESSYNRSVKIMLDLPYATHRSLIQPLTRVRA